MFLPRNCEEGKWNHASFDITSQSAQTMDIVCDKCLVKTEKASNYRVQYHFWFISSTMGLGMYSHRKERTSIHTHGVLFNFRNKEVSLLMNLWCGWTQRPLC
jgi:hypothetical protein